MNRFFKKFLCIVGLAVLSTVCAHAYDYTLWVKPNKAQMSDISELLTENHRQKRPSVFRFSSRMSRDVYANGTIKLLDEGRDFAVLVVNDADLESITGTDLYLGDLLFGHIFKIANAQTGVVRSAVLPPPVIYDSEDDMSDGFNLANFDEVSSRHSSSTARSDASVVARRSVFPRVIVTVNGPDTYRVFVANDSTGVVNSLNKVCHPGRRDSAPGTLEGGSNSSDF